MIRREDILSMPYLRKTEYTGCNQGMRYRLEKKVKEGIEKDKISDEDCDLLVTVWPEPFNYAKTPEEKKTRMKFTFDEDGIVDAIAWMNDLLFSQKDTWDNAGRKWDEYKDE